MNIAKRFLLTALGLGLTTAAVLADTPAANYHLIKTISVPGNDGWDYLTYSPRDQRLYIARSSHVTVVDTKKGEVVGDITDLSGVHGVALDFKTGHGFISNGRANSVTVFDIKSLKKISEVPVGEGPDAIVFDPATRRVFTLNGHGNSATAIDADTSKVVGTIALPGKPEFAVPDGKGHLYNNIEDKSEVVVLDTKALTLDKTWSLGDGESPSGLAFDAKDHRLFSVCDNQKMVVLDSDTGKVVAAPTIGNGPDACAYDATNHLVFSPNGEDGTLTVVKQDTPDKYTVAATVTTQETARTMALDEKTHRIFTVAAKPASPATAAPQGGRRRGYAPDSFVVLVYGP